MLGLIPLKDWAYLGIIVALIAGFAYWDHHERVIGEAKIEAADKAATARAVAAAEENNARLSSQYAEKLKGTENAYQLTLASAVTHADELAVQLHNYQNRRCSRPVPAGPATPGKPNDTAPVAGSDSSIAAATRRLLDAAAADAAQLQALEAERASLTGK
jgi:hypothetical protein